MTLLLPRLVIHQDSQTENPRVATLMTVIVYGHDALSGYHFQTISLQVSNGSVNIAHANMFPALSSACHSVAKIRCWRLLLLFSLYSPIFVLLDGGTLVLTPATPPFTNLIAIAVISQIRFQKPPVLPWVLDRLRTLAAIGCSRCDCSPGCVVQIGSRPRWQGVFPPSSLLLLSCMRFQHGVCGGLAVHRGQHHSNISIHIATISRCCLAYHYHRITVLFLYKWYR